MKTRTCRECNRDFTTNTSQLICSDECREKRKRLYYSRNPERFAMYEARKKERQVPRQPKQIVAIVRPCAECGVDFFSMRSISICIGGPHIRENLRSLCMECNVHRPRDGSDVTIVDAQLVLDALLAYPDEHRHSTWFVSAAACRRIIAGDEPELVDVTHSRRPSLYLRECIECSKWFQTKTKLNTLCSDKCSRDRQNRANAAWKSTPEGRAKQRLANEKWKRKNRAKYLEGKRNAYEKAKSKKQEMSHV